MPTFETDQNSENGRKIKNILMHRVVHRYKDTPCLLTDSAIELIMGYFAWPMTMNTFPQMRLQSDSDEQANCIWEERRTSKEVTESGCFSGEYMVS